MRIKIKGKVWRFLRARFDTTKQWGSCDRPHVKNKTIRVAAKLHGQSELDTIIHECLHAGFDSLDEEHVDEFATDLARILWRLGYRKENDA